MVTAATAVVAVIITALVALPVAVRSANNAARDELVEKSALAVELLTTERQVARERIVSRLRADGIDVYLIRRGAVAKGDPLQTARLAGVMAAKQTSALIPLCHPLPLTHVSVELTPTRRGYRIESRVRTSAARCASRRP